MPRAPGAGMRPARRWRWRDNMTGGEETGRCTARTAGVAGISGQDGWGQIVVQARGLGQKARARGMRGGACRRGRRADGPGHGRRREGSHGIRCDTAYRQNLSACGGTSRAPIDRRLRQHEKWTIGASMMIVSVQ